MKAAPAWLRRTLLGAGLCWLAGCATVPSGPVDYSGRLAVTVAAEGNRPAESHSAAFELGGDSHQGHLRLLSPLGTVVANATWEADHVRLETGDGPRDYPSLEALAEDTLGQASPWAPCWPGCKAAPGTGPPTSPMRRASSSSAGPSTSMP
jgi:outer membrane lipoprotein LolB